MVVILVTKSCLTLVIPWTVAHHTLLSMEFPREEYWHGSPFLSPLDLPDTGTEPMSLALWAVSHIAGRFFISEPPWKPILCSNNREGNGMSLFSKFSSVQSLSRVQLFVTPWIAACQASLSITNSQSLLKVMCIKSVMPSSHLILCHPLLLLPPVPPSIRVFSNESTLRMRWPKYWSFSFSIIPSKEYPGLISFRMDWLDLLAVQGTLKSLLQHHSSKPSILWCSAFFTVQLLHPYMTTGKP